MFAVGFRQINSLVNSNSRLLDLAFINLPERVDLTAPSSPLLPMDIHHPPFILLLCENDELLNLADDENYEVKFNFEVCDFELLNDIFGSTDWNALLGNTNLEAMLSAFYQKLNSVFGEHVPKTRRNTRSIFNKPWWTPELRNQRNNLRKARKRFFQSRDDCDRSHLQEIEIRYKTLLLSTYESYISTVQSSLKQNPSRFWEFVKNLQSSNRIPPSVTYNGIEAHNTSEAADLFAEFFESVFSKVSPVQRSNIFAHLQEHDFSFPDLQFSPDEVLEALRDLDIKKGPGTDGIPPLVIRNCAAALCIPITCIFNCSLRERTFPAAWKMAYIVPVYKSGSRNHVSNYRGISILCCLSKILEKLIHKTLSNTLTSIISESQHGFMKNRSTTTNLMSYVSTLFREVEARQQVDSIYVDFAKAFDTVPHIVVIEKFKRLGFPRWLTEWLYSYLTNRYAFVMVNSTRSRTFNITSGVPQGSVLGPLIFNVFINDLYSLLSSCNLSFADDLKFYRTISSPQDCIALQEDIDIMLIWCDNNGMRVNSGKCKIISFTRCNTSYQHRYFIGAEELVRVNSICDLGVTIDFKVRFNEHIGLTVAKAFSVLGMIRRHTNSFTDVYALKTLYCSLVRSILEYASPVWCPSQVTQILSIERVQKKFLRFALSRLPWNDARNLPSYHERCQLIRLESLSARRTNQQRLFIFDLIKGGIDCPALLELLSFNAPSRRFRNAVLLYIPNHRTNYGYNSSLSSCLRAFNDVGDKFDFDVTKNIFLNRIRN